MLTHKTTLLPESFAGTTQFDDDGPPVGGLLHKAPAEGELYPSGYKMLSSAQHRD